VVALSVGVGEHNPSQHVEFDLASTEIVTELSFDATLLLPRCVSALYVAVSLAELPVWLGVTCAIPQLRPNTFVPKIF
jgi:hypothetical protein